MPDKWYVFVNQATDGYEVGRIGAIDPRCVPISRGFDSAALAHDNLITRQHFPLNDRQLQFVQTISAVFGNGGPKSAARNQAFLDALVLENRWRGGELRPSIACRDAVRSAIDPSYVPSQAAYDMLQSLDIAGAPPLTPRRQVKRAHEREVGV